ncbi:MAG: efflux RND transporter periplasmic adaptor subunit [Clostridiales bacterium]|nr:efflux RND transporter periplasmic adaptor subunit [Clostridiales bacterium]
MKKKRRGWIVTLIVLAAVVVAATVLLNGSRGVQYAEATATMGDITTYFSFSGSIDVNSSLTVTAPADATVSEVYVRANSVVPKNARLMRLSDGSVIKTDIAGEVTALDVVPDGAVKAGDMLAEIMDLSTMKATFQVDEFDISAVEIGKTALITLDGTGATFEGPITSLNKRATQSGDLSYYTATIDLSGVTLPAEALPGMQITVKVLNKQAQNVVLLEMDAVSFTAYNVPYVMIRDGKETKTVDIQVGINDGANVEITSGLRNGDTVLYVPSSTDYFENMMAARRETLSSGAK